MTMEELKAMDKAIITPAQAAPLLMCDPHWIRIMAKTAPENLGFPVIVVGNRVKIPRIAFIKFLEGAA